MDRISHAERSTAPAALNPLARPRRRWSDGPNYAWSPASDENWSLPAQWPSLVALLAEQVAGTAHSVLHELGHLQARGQVDARHARSLECSVASLRSAGIAAQQIVRLGAGTVRPSPERVDLVSLVRTSVEERRLELEHGRVHVTAELRACDVLVDMPVAASLVHVALDWAAGFSANVHLKTLPMGTTRPARLVVRGTLPRDAQAVHARARSPHGRRVNDNLHWVLLQQLGLCAGLTISRSSTAATESAVVEFPRAYAPPRRAAGPAS